MRQTILLSMLVLVLAAQISWAQIPQTMSYQGVLADAGGAPVADGSYDLTFSIYDVATGGVALWTETQSVAVVNGVFSVILGSVNPLTPDFDQQYWLGITVGAGPEMTPRTKLTASPYSLNSRSVADDAVTGDAIADGHVVRSINGNTDNVTLAEGTNVTITPTGNTLTISAAFDGWSLTGNAGTTAGTHFLGTTDDVPLELHVNNTRALLLEPHASGPNIIGGASSNSVVSGAFGATISGGGNGNRVTDEYGTVGGGGNNQAGDAAGTTEDATYATVGGGESNTASGEFATIGGGTNNTTSESGATVGGGAGNTANGDFVTVGGGIGNIAVGNSATVGGGISNNATGASATVGGGGINNANGNFATVGGGQSNNASAKYATISGGGTSSPGDPATGNRVTDDYGTVGGGGNNQAGDAAGTTEDTRYATVGGGESNNASGDFGTVGGGTSNNASGDYSTVSGGVSNNASAMSATVGGGYDNNASESGATVSGGASNTVSKEGATIGGGVGNTASAKCATISGGGRSNLSDPATGNRVTDEYGTVGGGGNNQAGDAAGTTEDASYAIVGGGIFNTASGMGATVGGGSFNTASGNTATVGGGSSNTASDDFATVGGGVSNTASGDYSAVDGGQSNTASGDYSAVGGGYDNTASGDYSFVAGRRAKCSVSHHGTFMFSDSQDYDLNSVAINGFAVRCTGGAGFVTAIDGSGAATAGSQLASGGGSWSSISDRNLKENFSPMDGREVLKRLASIPVESWNYKSQDASIRHMGPMAQDFYATFGLGEDNKHITTVDADGVALAAIQGLYELVREKQIEASELRAENTSLKQRLDEQDARLKVMEEILSSLALEKTK